mgnify:CR=1 FL=1
MITPADAMEVLTLIAACHHRTAPRLDDEATARATATVWAELLNAHRLDKADALAAVKRRAATNPVAPEPAEVIAVAREIRRDRDARTGPTDAYEALCESKAEDAAELAANRKRLNALVSSLADQKGLPSE